jgi:hypothetical protein
MVSVFTEPEHVAVYILGAVNLVALLAGIYRLQRIASHVETTFNFFALEHEMLMQDYADRQGIKMEELPTRLKRAPWWGFS